MTHMSIPTVPTARDRALAYEPRHRFTPSHLRVMIFKADENRDPANLARCTGGDEFLWGESCLNSVCPRHAPEAYAECKARHAPETLVMRHGMLLTLAEVPVATALGYFTGPEPTLGTTLDVPL